jgi:hypothetical protein
VIPERGPYSGRSYLLYEDYNDIHLFVEDAGFENLYGEIVRRCGLRVRKVFSRTGKESVIEAARTSHDPRCVYVIDRDWDDAHGITYALGNLVVLDKHSIENYLLDYSGFYSIVLADNPKADMATLFSVSVYNNIVQQTSEALRPLFECYLAMQLSRDTRPNCSRAPGSFQQKNATGRPDSARIASFITRIGRPIPQHVRDYFAGDVLRDKGHGKYMLHFIWTQVRRTAETGQLQMDKLRIRLAQQADPGAFRDLCDGIARCRKQDL